MVSHRLQILSGGTQSIEVYGANYGTTELVISFPSQNGGTELRIPVEVTDGRPRRRAARH